MSLAFSKRLSSWTTPSQQNCLSATTLEVLFQGPVSDVLTHIGQLGMLRRVAGSPIKGEVMVIADVHVGRVGFDQAAPKREFD